ncbi:MAG: serine/threonine-protein kinase [Archangium sp.]|nr:serine/threonine-protein kinase [Archangium sp.]
MTKTLGKYTLLRKLATGGMAEVFLARADGPMGFAKKCVVKRILPHFNDDPRFIEMFLGEARLAAELNHPNLVQIFDFGEADGQYYLAMEYIDGANLRVLNQATRRVQGPMPFPLAARMIALAAEGLHFAHELRNEQGEFLNLVHRDISPDNILVARNGSVKVVDFGIAKASTQPHLTKSGMIKGKMAYMPPEQLAREPLDRRADLFALGIVFYELVTGGMPFDATSEVSIIQAIMSQKPLEKPTVYRPDCPPDLEAIVNKCLEKDRDRRYASCVELQADLEAFIRRSGETVGTREIAQLVSTVFENEADTTAPNAVASGLDATTPSAKSSERISPPAPVATQSGTGMSNTALRSVEVNAVKRSRAPLFVGLALVATVVAGLGGWLALRPDVVPVKPLAVIDAGSAVIAAAPDAAVAIAVVVDAEPDAGLESEEVDAGAVAVAVARPVAAKTGKLELRIRPYATIYLDDRLLGDTPLPAISVPVGKHKLRLVNPAFGKDVELNIVIKPGENVVKHNLKD